MTVPMRAGRGHRMPPAKQKPQKAPQSPKEKAGKAGAKSEPSKA